MRANPLGRPKKPTASNRHILKQQARQRRQQYRQRIPIEGKFGQGKNGYRLNAIRAKTKATSEVWIRSIFLVMNLLALVRAPFWLGKREALWTWYGWRWFICAIEQVAQQRRALEPGYLSPT
ncbi:MAG: transposase [Gammaproteobacteria bacterium]|nr:transposase [Gammaproteobacteria bacterium]